MSISPVNEAYYAVKKTIIKKVKNDGPGQAGDAHRERCFRGVAEEPYGKKTSEWNRKEQRRYDCNACDTKVFLYAYQEPRRAAEPPGALAVREKLIEQPVPKRQQLFAQVREYKGAANPGRAANQ